MPFNRSDFPMLSRKIHEGSALVYLDSASTTLKPRQVIDTIVNFYSHDYGTVHRAAYALAALSTQRYMAVRELVQSHLHAKSIEEIIFTKGTTESINLVAASFGEAFVTAGDEVIISGAEHHSNILPWKFLCDKKNAHLRVIPLLQDGTLDLRAYSQMLSSRTKIVSVAHVSNLLGIVNPLPSIIEQAHAKGAKVFVDGAQSAPHMLIDVQKLDCDFFTFSGHKIYGPTGIGILYGKKNLLEQMPPYQLGSDMVQFCSFKEVALQALPLKFEAGTPMIAEVMGLGAALSYLNHYGIHRIASYETSLIKTTLERLSQWDEITILGPLHNRTSLITFFVKGMHSLDVASFLDAKGIALRSGHLCAQPMVNHFGLDSVLRVSVAPYNTHEEMDYFCENLKAIFTLAL